MNRYVIVALRAILTLLSVGMIAFIFYNSSLNDVESTEQSDFVLEFINGLFRSLGIGVELGDLLIRKAAHFTEYFVLGGLIGGAVYSYALDRRGLLIFTLPVGLAVAVCDELIQTGSAGRSCSVWDMILDFSAVLTAALLLSAIISVYLKKKEKKEGERYE